MSTPARAVMVSALLAIGCAPQGPTARCAYEVAPRAEGSAAYRYRVAVAPRAEELCVEVDVPKSPGQRWAPEGPLRPFVRDVAIASSGGFSAVGIVDGMWQVPACAAPQGCRLRYRVLLADAARALGDYDLAEEHRGAFLAPPSSWLLRPPRLHATFQLAVTTPPEVGFVTGLVRSSTNARSYAGDIAALDDTPYAAFGPLSLRVLSLAGGALDVAFTPGDLTAGVRAGIDAWIDGAARAVTAYFGRFPIPRAAVIVKIEPGTGIGDGHTMGNGGGAVLISVGEKSRPGDFAEDWVLVHEMVHLSFPDVGRPWAEEGLATYLEPIIRARAGAIAEDEIWRGLIEGLPHGLPEDGDQGLDRTDTWGRRYWGGALFWLLADLEIRERTGNARSLDDVLRAVSRAGGNVSVRWDLDRTLAIGDEAVGVPVLRPLRARMGNAPIRVDLAALWKRLGVSLTGGRVTYDDGAPLAAFRRGIGARGAAAPTM